jgi:hypothetical protein
LCRYYFLCVVVMCIYAHLGCNLMCVADILQELAHMALRLPV